MKLLKSTNIEIIKYCQEQFDFHLPSVLIARRTTNFLVKLQVLLVRTLSSYMRNGRLAYYLFVIVKFS